MTARAYMAAAIVAALSAWCGMEAEEQRLGTIRGRVTDASTGQAVPFQSVRIAKTDFGTSTDAEGWFVLRNIPQGAYELVVTGVGYAAATIQVELRAHAAADTVSLQLKQEDVAMAEVQIVVEAAAKNADTPVSVRMLSPHDVQTGAGGMDDAMRTLSILPGVAPMRLERHDLIVRGGAPFENLFIVDNIEFPTISHFAVQGAGTGTSSTITTDFIERVSFSSGGYGVRRGDRLSSVVALTLREGSREKHAASVTLSATQFGASAEGPLSKAGSFLVSLRRSYLEPVFKAYDMSFAPVYWDGCVKATVAAGGSGVLKFIAVGTADRMHLFEETQSKRETNAGLVFGNQKTLNAGATWEQYRERWWTLLAVSNHTGAYSYYQPEDGTRRRSTIDSHENEMSVSADASVFLTPTLEAAFGMKTRFIRFRGDVFLGEPPWFLNVNGSLASIEKHADTSGIKHAAYLQLSERIGAVTVSAGVRADHFSLLAEPLALAPRASVIWRIADGWEATGSAGRYYQAPASSWLVNPYNMKLKHAGADHVIAGISSTIGGEWKAGLEAYEKRYFDYPVSVEAPCMTVFNSGSPGSNFKDFGLDSLTSRGSGRARGIELVVQKYLSSDSPFSGMLSLTLSETNFTALDGVERPADHDQRWIMNMVVGCKAGEAWEITGRFRLFTGHPYTDRFILNYGTLAQYAREYNALRVGVNHMLDLRVTRRWEMQSARIEVFLDVQNVYNKKPLDTPEADLKTGAYKETAMVGIVPSLGIKLSL